MANVEKIRETIAVIKQNLPRWKQDRWAQGIVNPDAATWQECGTAFCAAGWRCVLDGLRPVPNADSHATSMFVNPATGATVHPLVWATHSLELTVDQAAALFAASSHITDVADLEWIAEAIIDGHEFDECETCGSEGIECTDNWDYVRCTHCHGRGVVIVDSADV